MHEVPEHLDTWNELVYQEQKPVQEYEIDWNKQTVLLFSEPKSRLLGQRSQFKTPNAQITPKPSNDEEHWIVIRFLITQ